MAKAVKTAFPRKKYMRCPDCNHILAGRETFCRNCGEFVPRKKNTEFVIWLRN